MKYVDWKIVRFLEKKSYKVDETIHFNPEKYCSKIDEKLQRYKTSRRAKFGIFSKSEGNSITI